MTEDNFEAQIPIHKLTFAAEAARIGDLLLKIHPRKGNFLFPDIVGRYIWEACATCESIQLLAEAKNDYGVKSLIRKLLEAQLYLDYLFQNKDQSLPIAQVMAHDYFEKTDHSSQRKSEAITQAHKIVHGMNEDPQILIHFESLIQKNKNGWNWTGRTSRKIINETLVQTGDSIVDKMIEEVAISYLNTCHKAAHLNINLNEDHLTEDKDGQLSFSNPHCRSAQKLVRYLGLGRLLVRAICLSTEKNLERMR